MGRAHVIAIPYPAQGHVIPMLELAQTLVINGVRVTFVNTQSIHRRLMDTLPSPKLHDLLNLVSVSDGLQSWEDRLDLAKILPAINTTLPAEVAALIESMHTDAPAVTCIITDAFMAGVMQACRKFQLKTAAFLPSSAAFFALMISAEKLAAQGVIDVYGNPLHSSVIRLSPSMPETNSSQLPWTSLPNLAAQKAFFDHTIDNNKSINLANFLVCNTSSELEAAAVTFMHKCLPIGPLLASSRLAKQSGHFWPENPTCLSWLNQQNPNSVMYVAFGSFTVLDSVQFQELALGLELTNRPFLWVVRQDITENTEEGGAYPVGFQERVKNRGKIVNWAPQQQVLSHPSVACFVSHCGWNSTLESVSNGVPVLCWPYFTDQFLNQTYIVDHWHVGLRLERDDASGMFGREEIKKKVELLFEDEGYKTRMLKLQETTLATTVNGGSSHKNLSHFIDWIKENST